MDMDDFRAKYDATLVEIKQYPFFKDFGISRFKHLNTRDGVAFNCILTYKGKACGTAENSGTGGPDYIEITMPEAGIHFNAMKAIAKTFSPYETEGMVLDAILKAHGK